MNTNTAGKNIKQGGRYRGKGSFKAAGKNILRGRGSRTPFYKKSRLQGRISSREEGGGKGTETVRVLGKNVNAGVYFI